MFENLNLQPLLATAALQKSNGCQYVIVSKKAYLSGQPVRIKLLNLQTVKREKVDIYFSQSRFGFVDVNQTLHLPKPCCQLLKDKQLKWVQKEAASQIFENIVSIDETEYSQLQADIIQLFSQRNCQFGESQNIRTYFGNKAMSFKNFSSVDFVKCLSNCTKQSIVKRMLDSWLENIHAIARQKEENYLRNVLLQGEIKALGLKESWLHWNNTQWMIQHPKAL